MPHPVSQFIVDNFFWVFIAILVLNLMQRRYRKEVERKRSATLYLAIIVFLLNIYAYGVIRLQLSDFFIAGYAVVAIVVIVRFKNIFFPFAYHCRECHRVMDFNRIVYFDSNLCASCAEKARPSDPQGEADGA